MFDPERIDMLMRLRGRGISDNNVLRAMELVPRKNFLSREHLASAYLPMTLPIACGQEMSSPYDIAIMSQMLELEPDHKLLEIGTGSGYHAAVLSQICRRVYTVERYHGLLKGAEAQFEALGIVNVVSRHGDGRYGWPGQAPFDRILLTCGVRAMPDSLLKQLAPGGRIAAACDGQFTIATKARVRTEERQIMPMSLPMIEAGKSKIL
jgi:protein-L-isoaspartate(D-aspartate) O-methyltransferase